MLCKSCLCMPELYSCRPTLLRGQSRLEIAIQPSNLSEVASHRSAKTTAARNTRDVNQHLHHNTVHPIHQHRTVPRKPRVSPSLPPHHNHLMFVFSTGYSLPEWYRFRTSGPCSSGYRCCPKSAVLDGFCAIPRVNSCGSLIPRVRHSLIGLQFCIFGHFLGFGGFWCF
ncbi:hypothetical protein EJ05DRAFT_163039 [Pseudovirgaria hyperparasitica]|uniref:Uncharacterized protein n=1 Tax=Pseudovirgaria hyperparasitica TaxID=470096 RepID=A0A6A6VVZ9_9PEZI|nr:uncharacterized protein EJ05DRAFT_163039 [Pseudovirgaria hyperparasitica]KAF2754039.1 hypothetical protein EJ05DRAFT_163039 [Pseudovirgaria hyperparasitica]